MAGGTAAYITWIIERALPTWSTDGFDARRGRFRERLGWSGAPLAVPHRAMVQARQIYVYARACELGWFAEGGAQAERAMASLVRDFGAVSRDGASFAFAVDTAGTVVDDSRDAYTHAFVLHALAWLYGLNGDQALLQLADRVRAFIASDLMDARHGGVFDAVPLATREKRQNPLMHLLEAYLALERVAPGRGGLEEARELIQLFTTRLFDSRQGILREYFAEDWAPSTDPTRADLWEPGHHFEWVWLLREYARLSGDHRADESARRLYDVARSSGVADDGLVYDALGADGTVHASSHRVWPHTEGIKASVARRGIGEPGELAFGEAMARQLLAHFLGRPFAGGWIDHIDAQRRPLVTYVPASSLYHLFFAATEAAHALGQGDAVPPVGEAWPVPQ